MTLEQFKNKWDKVDIDKLTLRQYRNFKNDCFSMYEETGFLDKFDSPYDEENEHNGMAFHVLRRATEKECDLESMPIWFIRFENSDTAYCYPEEICIVEHNKEN